jgi:hypothetical protein
MDPKDTKNPRDPARETKTDTSHEDRSTKRSAPPIEREHETQSGILEEDEKREHEGR